MNRTSGDCRLESARIAEGADRKGGENQFWRISRCSAGVAVISVPL